MRGIEAGSLARRVFSAKGLASGRPERPLIRVLFSIQKSVQRQSPIRGEQDVRLMRVFGLCVAVVLTITPSILLFRVTCAMLMI